MLLKVTVRKSVQVRLSYLGRLWKLLKIFKQYEFTSISYRIHIIELKKHNQLSESRFWKALLTGEICSLFGSSPPNTCVTTDLLTSKTVEEYLRRIQKRRR